MNKKILILFVTVLLLTTFFNTNSIKAEESSVPSEQGGNVAVIVSGGAIYDPLTVSFIKTAMHSRDVYRSFGYNIADGILYEDMMIQPLKHKVKTAITEWIPNNIGGERKVVIHFINHGWDAFLFDDLRGSLVLNTVPELITPNNLASWLDEIDGVYSTCTIIIDTCFSGNWIPVISGENRIIMTATDKESFGYAIDEQDQWLHGENLFSYHLLNALSDGRSYGKAWEYADAKVLENMIEMNYSEFANPQIDDNGDGKGSGNRFMADTLPLDGDGFLALDTWPVNRDEEKQTDRMFIRTKRNLRFILDCLFVNNKFIKNIKTFLLF